MDKLTASEALYGFAGWLTTRDERVAFSARDNAGPAAELVHDFCKANGLTEPREGWSMQLVSPPTDTKLDRQPSLDPFPLLSIFYFAALAIRIVIDWGEWHQAFRLDWWLVPGIIAGSLLPFALGLLVGVTRR